MLKLSDSVQRIAPSETMAISAKAAAMKRAGEDVIALAAGEPDFDTPSHIVAAAKKALDDGFTKYTPAAGTPDLRAAWAAKIGSRRGVTYTPSQVIVSAGGKQAVFNTIYALAGTGDEVILPAPYWVSYSEQIKAVGATPVIVEAGPEDDFKLSPQALRDAITERTSLLIFCSPSNPTGSVYSRSELEALAEVLVEHQVPVLSDEVYEDLVYGMPFASLASLGPEMYSLTVIVTAVSKSYAMTGWRIGCAAGPADVIAAQSRLQSHTTSGANSIAQVAALTAITGDQSSVEEMRVEFDRRRKYMVQRLQAMEGVVCPEPLGAFYTFPQVSAYYGRSFGGPPIESSLDFCSVLLQEAKLAVIPGGAFGADGHVRLSYAVSMQEIEEALNRFEWFLSKLE